MTTKLMLSIKDTQIALSLGRTTIYRLLATNQLCRAKVEGRTLVTVESVEKLILEAVARANTQ